MLTAARRPARRRKRPGDVRAAVLAAARRLYFAHGAAGVSARKIAQAVGCSPTAIYLYYRGIADLLEHLRMEGHALLARALQDVDPRLPALERVKAMGRAYHRFGVAHRRYYALMFSLRPEETPRREAVQREMLTLMLLRDAVQVGMARGEIRRDLDPMVVTNVLWAKIHGVTALAVSGLLPETAAGHDAEVLDAMLESAVRWLGAVRPRGAENLQR
jgi:AcrR family transcriptional regulator